MIGIAERHGDEDKPAGHQQLQAMVGQPIGLGDMLEQVAAEQCARMKRPKAEHVAVIGQIGLTFDEGQFAPIDMDDLDAAGSLQAEQLSSIESCTTLRISVELLARLSSGDSRSGGNASNAPREPAPRLQTSRSRAPLANGPRCPKPISLGKRDMRGPPGDAVPR